jgi:hypothetical protein
MISQRQVQKWFKGNTANLAYLVKDERDKFARKHGSNPWSNEARRGRADELPELMDKAREKELVS